MKAILKKYLNEDSKYYRPLTIVLFILSCIVIYSILYIIGYIGDYYGSQIYTQTSKSLRYIGLPIFGCVILLSLSGVFLMFKGLYDAFCNKLNNIINGR